MAQIKDVVKFEDVTKLVTMDEKQVAKINSRLPEYHRASAIVGHSTSQSSYSLQTMQMITDSPLQRMKQCLAQIDKKYKALQEAYFNVEKKKLQIQNLEKRSTFNCIFQLAPPSSIVYVPLHVLHLAEGDITLMSEAAPSIIIVEQVVNGDKD